MRLTVQLKLLPTPQQADALRRTLETANAVCNAISQVAWKTQTFRQFPLHRLTYRSVRKTFPLSAQVVVRCIAKVAEAYQHDTNTKPVFKPHGSVAYDDRILSFALSDALVSIWTLEGRQTIPFICGDRQQMLLAYRRGETDLVFSNGSWYLYASCEVQTPQPFEAEGVLGVDLGVTNIATDSDGEVYSGKAMKNVRHRHRRLRQKLQRKGTLGARRRLKKLSGKERRFATYVNHCLSKRMVAKAECTKRAIALEDLTHIRTRMKACRSQRATLHSWSFAQLQGRRPSPRAFIAYKAVLKGVPVH
ncbi:MAG TPA: transposase [Chthonomonas sp.]|uniref:RNA-guided endonuclease InsQ/TnpB family protein n=1 Tax=Chthonomonas sp. TaxID=2282153 RepID=UPI002B4B7FFD|nr:transposase [Chthonomonas sp.]HLI50035.1 transposase [Chthonomonas sp.]